MENVKKQFSIKIKGQVFESDEDGMLDLNKIHNGMDLKPSKRPNEFYRYTKGRYFLENGNSRLNEIKNLGAGTTKYYSADEHSTIAYAMWVSESFYMEVLNSFIDLRNGRIEDAVVRASNSMSQSDGDKLKEMVWENINGMKVINQRTALQVAGIKHPIIFMRELRKRTKAYKRLQDEGKIVYQTYDQGKWTDRFTQEGFQWLLDKAETMNCWVEEIKVSNKKLSKSLQG